jgi:hypothetical protein
LAADDRSSESTWRAREREEETKIKFKKGSEKKRVREQRSEGREKLVSVDLVVKFVDEPVDELLLIL